VIRDFAELLGGLDLEDAEVAKSVMSVLRARVLDYTHPDSEAWSILSQLSDDPLTHAEITEKTTSEALREYTARRDAYACQVLLSRGLVESRLREGVREYWLTFNPKLLDRERTEGLEVFVDALFEVP